MENKTISYLNSNAWYRLLKVVFVLTFFVVLVGYNLIIFGSGVKKLDLTKTQVTCHVASYNATTQPKPFNLSDMDLGQYWFNNSDFTNYDYKNFYSNITNEDKVKNILSKCTGVAFSQINLPFWQATADIQKDNPNLKTLDEAVTKLNNYITKGTDPNTGFTPYNLTTQNRTASDLENYHKHLFDITPKYSYAEFIKYFFIGNLVILLLFEVMRRAFYYIVLGTLKPKKNN